MAIELDLRLPWRTVSVNFGTTPTFSVSGVAGSGRILPCDSAENDRHPVRRAPVASTRGGALQMDLVDPRNRPRRRSQLVIVFAAEGTRGTNLRRLHKTLWRATPLEARFQGLRRNKRTLLFARYLYRGYSSIDEVHMNFILLNVRQEGSGRTANIVLIVASRRCVAAMKPHERR
jgi:hypothetical protein